MNRHFNKIGLALSAGLTLAVFSSSLTLAASTPFCTNLSTTISTVNTNITNLTAKLTTAQTDRLAKLNSNWAKDDQTLATDRANWAAQRQTEFSKLSAKATTSAEQSAVATFGSTITTAIATRESANDSARATYRTAVTNLVTAQQSTVNGQAAAFKTTVEAAESTASDNCVTRPTDTTIRTTFQAALKSARTTYVGYRTSDGGLSTQVKALAATRDAAIKANDATFTVAQTAAETALKAAF